MLLVVSIKVREVLSIKYSMSQILLMRSVFPWRRNTGRGIHPKAPVEFLKIWLQAKTLCYSIFFFFLVNSSVLCSGPAICTRVILKGRNFIRQIHRIFWREVNNGEICLFCETPNISMIWLSQFYMTVEMKITGKLVSGCNENCAVEKYWFIERISTFTIS